MRKKTFFERAIFLSWYCSKGDCKFCYMSTQQKLISDPRNARRDPASIFAEILLCKEFGWKIEFLSGGYESYTTSELLFIIKKVHEIYKEKLWLNIGVLSEKELKLFKPHIKGVCGAVETVNPSLHKRICPSKPINEIEAMFRSCEKLGLKKAMTSIIGLGETISDFTSFEEFVKRNMIDRITFYRLKPIKGTQYKKGPSKKYYLNWVKRTRKAFPKMDIVAGSWVDKVDELDELLKYADNFTKFPALRLFGSKPAHVIEDAVKKAGRELNGTLTKSTSKKFDRQINQLNLNKEMKKRVGQKIKQYLK